MAKIKLISHLLIPFPNLFLFELIWSLLSHLSAIKALNFLFLQPISSTHFMHLLLPSFDTQVEHSEGVSHEIELDFFVKGAISTERG